MTDKVSNANPTLPFYVLGAMLVAGPASAANLSVQVLERGSGQPVAAAAVCLGTSADTDQFGAVRTNSDGAVVFEDILDAPLVLTVSKDGFRGERRPIPGMSTDRVTTVLLPRGGLGPQCEAAPIGPDELELRVRNFRVDDGAATTGDRSVTLNFSAGGEATDYRASESRDFAGAQWQPLSAERSFQLSPGGGEKRVYLQLRKYRQAEGLRLETLSEVVSDTIELRR